MIELRNASRWYGPVIGINDVTCRIEPGITALLGPNGAGKSTMLKLVTGQLRPTTGRVTVLGEAPFANARVYRRLGYCPEGESLYDELTGREFVSLLASLAGIPRASVAARTADEIERVGMTANADRRIGGYSKGMRQRIKLAQSLVHDPEILILDEPLNGLDPLSRREISMLLTELAAGGKGILISSHILFEVEQMTSSILLMNRGRLLAQGDIYRIRSLIDSHPHRITIDADAPRDLAKRLLDMPYVLSVRLDEAREGRIEIETRSPESFYSQFPELVLDRGITVRSFESPDNNLEAVFSYLVNP